MDPKCVDINNNNNNNNYHHLYQKSPAFIKRSSGEHKRSPTPPALEKLLSSSSSSPSSKASLNGSHNGSRNISPIPLQADSSDEEDSVENSTSENITPQLRERESIYPEKNPQLENIKQEIEEQIIKLKENVDSPEIFREYTLNLLKTFSILFHFYRIPFIAITSSPNNKSVSKKESFESVRANSKRKEDQLQNLKLELFQKCQDVQECFPDKLLPLTDSFERNLKTLSTFAKGIISHANDILEEVGQEKIYIPKRNKSIKEKLPFLFREEKKYFTLFNESAFNIELKKAQEWLEPYLILDIPLSKKTIKLLNDLNPKFKDLIAKAKEEREKSENRQKKRPLDCWDIRILYLYKEILIEFCTALENENIEYYIELKIKENIAKNNPLPPKETLPKIIAEELKNNYFKEYISNLQKKRTVWDGKVLSSYKEILIDFCSNLQNEDLESYIKYKLNEITGNKEIDGKYTPVFLKEDYLKTITEKLKTDYIEGYLSDLLKTKTQKFLKNAAVKTDASWNHIDLIHTHSERHFTKEVYSGDLARGINGELVEIIGPNGELLKPTKYASEALTNNNFIPEIERVFSLYYQDSKGTLFTKIRWFLFHFFANNANKLNENNSFYEDFCTSYQNEKFYADFKELIKQLEKRQNVLNSPIYQLIRKMATECNYKEDILHICKSLIGYKEKKGDTSEKILFFRQYINDFIAKQTDRNYFVQFYSCIKVTLAKFENELINNSIEDYLKKTHQEVLNRYSPEQIINKFITFLNFFNQTFQTGNLTALRSNYELVFERQELDNIPLNMREQYAANVFTKIKVDLRENEQYYWEKVYTLISKGYIIQKLGLINPARNFDSNNIKIISVFVYQTENLNEHDRYSIQEIVRKIQFILGAMDFPQPLPTKENPENLPEIVLDKI